jgi:hypothetical protein
MDANLPGSIDYEPHYDTNKIKKQVIRFFSYLIVALLVFVLLDQMSCAHKDLDYVIYFPNLIK